VEKIKIDQYNFSEEVDKVVGELYDKYHTVFKEKGEKKLLYVRNHINDLLLQDIIYLHDTPEDTDTDNEKEEYELISGYMKDEFLEELKKKKKILEVKINNTTSDIFNYHVQKLRDSYDNGTFFIESKFIVDESKTVEDRMNSISTDGWKDEEILNVELPLDDIVKYLEKYVELTKLSPNIDEDEMTLDVKNGAEKLIIDLKEDIKILNQIESQLANKQLLFIKRKEEKKETTTVQQSENKDDEDDDGFEEGGPYPDTKIVEKLLEIKKT